jgi:hypothetical protein
LNGFHLSTSPIEIESYRCKQPIICIYLLYQTVVARWIKGKAGLKKDRLTSYPVVHGLRPLHQRPRARAKTTSHVKHRCILPGGVAKARHMVDIPALSRLAHQAPQCLKSVNFLLREP